MRRRQRDNQHAGPSWQIMASFQWQACGTAFLLQCLHTPCRQTLAE